MVSGSARAGRGGGQIGRARAGALSAEEELERRRWISDAARIRGSYRYLRYGLQPTPALQGRKTRHHRASSSSSAFRAIPPPHRLNFGAPRVDDNEATSSVRPRPVLRFDLGDLVPDDQIPMVAAVLTPGDFVHESALGTITSLMEEKTLREAKKAEEWRREQEAQDAKFVELSDSDESD